MTGAMGNPAPIGLMAFALTIFMLGILKADLVDPHFKELVTAFGFWWAGLGQVATGLLEVLHGNSFGALIFWTYGSLWMGLSTVWHYTIQNVDAHGAHGYVGAHHYKTGESIMLILFALATAFFFVVALRKNRALPTCLFLLFWSTIFLAIGEHVEVCVKIGGWGCMLTGLSAFYILAAEIVNEEWGYPLMPGITPLARKIVEDYTSVFQFDKAKNSVFLNLTGCHFMSAENVDKFEAALIEKFDGIGQKVHVVVNYKGVEIAPSVHEHYGEAISRLQNKYYLSVKRFAASAFRDVATDTGDVPETVLRQRRTSQSMSAEISKI